jgi:hypothetical protein
MADAPVIHFDKAAFQALMNFVKTARQDVDDKFFKSTGGLMLNGDLGTDLMPGNDAWTPVSKLRTAAGTFGASVTQQLGSFTDDLESYYQELGKALSVYHDQDDLATVSAESFVNSYPGLSGGSTSI